MGHSHYSPPESILSLQPRPKDKHYEGKELCINITMKTKNNVPASVLFVYVSSGTKPYWRLLFLPHYVTTQFHETSPFESPSKGEHTAP